MISAMGTSKRRWLPNIGSRHEDSMDARTIHALAVLLFLVQLPHLGNLPLWVSTIGLFLVGARIVLLKKPDNKWLRAIISPLSVTIIAVVSALTIRWDYGYFIGRDPCVAFLFILVAAKFAEVRRPADATLLLCLCAFLLLTQYFYSQTIVSAIITLPAVVALAYSLSTLRDATNPEGTLKQLRMIGTLLLQGLPLAAVLFLVFPRMPGPLWSLPEDAMATTGLSDSMSPGSIGQLSLSDAVAFRVEFDGNLPTPSELYWRGPVLTDFDGRNWGLSKLPVRASKTYSGPSENLTNYTVTLQPHRQRWLFALDQAASLPQSYSAVADTDQRFSRRLGMMLDDGQLLARKTVSQTIRYRQSSLLSSVSPGNGTPRRDTLFLPGDNTRTVAFAKQMRERYASDSEYAQAVMQYFHEQPFRYTLQPQILGHSPVDEFLFDTREGFCEHYASAFVVMMRAAGIASRVVTGYLGGEINDDYMIVRQSDAHAWTEAFIDGAWRRFDPTNAVAPSRIESGLSAALPDEASVPRMARQAPGLLRDMQLRWDAINYQWQRLVVDFDNDSQAGLWERMGLGTPSLWQLWIGVIALAGIWSAFVLGIPRLSGKQPSTQERYWQTLIRMLDTRSLPRHRNESADEFLQRAAQRWPSQKNRLARLHHLFGRLRFQPHGSEESTQMLKECRAELVYLRLALLLKIGTRHPRAEPNEQH